MSTDRLPVARRIWGPAGVRLEMEDEAALFLINLLSTAADDVGARELRDELIRAVRS